MEIVITTTSGKHLLLKPQLIFDVDITNLSDTDWQYCADTAPMQRVDGAFNECFLYIGNDSEYIDELGRSIIEHGCSQDLLNLIELAWTSHATWLLIHKE